MARIKKETNTNKKYKEMNSDNDGNKSEDTVLPHKRKNNSIKTPKFNPVSSPYSIFCRIFDRKYTNHIVSYFLWNSLSDEVKNDFSKLYLKQFENIIDNDYGAKDEKNLTLCSPVGIIEFYHLPFIYSIGRGYPMVTPYEKFVMENIEKYRNSWDPNKAELIAIQLSQHWNKLSEVDKEKYHDTFKSKADLN